MKKNVQKFYYINNIIDTDWDIGYEMLLVFDKNKEPIYHHDWHDSSFDFPDHLPRDFIKRFKVRTDAEFIDLNDTEIALLLDKSKIYC